MKPIEKKTYKDFPKAPEGQHISQLVGLIDLGSQKIEFQGVAKFRPKIYLQFEVYPENENGTVITGDDGSFFLVGQDYTVVMTDNSKILPFINSWRGKPLEEADFPFDFSRLLGRYGLMNIVHNKSSDGTKSYANIGSITPVPKKLAYAANGDSILPLSSTKPWFFDMDNPDWEGMLKLMELKMWDGIRSKIKESPEFQARNGGKSAEPAGKDDKDDYIPF